MSGYINVPVGAHTTNGTLSSAVSLTPASTDVDVLLVMAFTQAVRYTLDGTTPTATTGFKLAVNTLLEIPVRYGSTVKVIEETASASIQYQWAKQTRVQV